MSRAIAAHEMLLAAWQRETPPIVTRQASEAEIEALEARYAIGLPPPFRTYLLHACPVEDAILDSNLTYWWPLGRLRSLAEELPDKGLGKTPIPNPDSLLVFADYMFWCFAWAIDCSPGPGYGKILLIDEKPHIVAESFAAFVARYLEDHDSVL